jgi:hypothetical protein
MDLVGLYAFGFGLFTIGFGDFNYRLWLLLWNAWLGQSWDLQIWNTTSNPIGWLGQLEIERIPGNINAGDMVANAESIVSYSQQS